MQAEQSQGLKGKPSLTPGVVSKVKWWHKLHAYSLAYTHRMFLPLFYYCHTDQDFVVTVIQTENKTTIPKEVTV